MVKAILMQRTCQFAILKEDIFINYLEAWQEKVSQQWDGILDLNFI